MNIVQAIFLSWTIFMGLMGILVNVFGQYLPGGFIQLMNYGKAAQGTDKSHLREVPKSGYKHIYAFASVVQIYVCVFVSKTYLYNEASNGWFRSVLEYLYGSEQQQATGLSIHVLLAIILFTLQCLRRFHDTHFVSVFSKTATVNICHYLMGYAHYWFVPVAILANFNLNVSSPMRYIDSLEIIDYLATLLFLWAWWHQYKTTVILGNLRKNKEGATISEKYRLPMGDWFEHLSCPHYQSEVLMYFSLAIIQRTNNTFWFVFVWVFINQIEICLLSHWWYQKTFPDLPAKRKALIPFVY